MSKSIFVIAIVEIFCAFIVGIVLGNGTDSFGEHSFNFQIALIYWVAGIISGVLLIGFSEVIRLLDNISRKMDGSADIKNQLEISNNENTDLIKREDFPEEMN